MLLASLQASSSSAAGPIAREDRDEGRAEGAGHDELEDRVGDAERREVGVQLAAGAELRADDEQPDPAEESACQRGPGEDEARGDEHAVQPRCPRSTAGRLRLAGRDRRCPGGPRPASPSRLPVRTRRRGDAPRDRRCAARHRRGGCRSGSSGGSRGRAAPARPAGRRRPRAGASRTSGAGCAGWSASAPPAARPSGPGRAARRAR